MHCTSCGFANPEGMEFCTECGVRLQNSCLRCGFVNALQAKFCGKCGSSLTARQKAKGRKDEEFHVAPSPDLPVALSSPEECFQKAIEIARQQQAKSLELRAVMSLSRLWQQQGKQKEAHKLLSEIYNWFTEGFDTKDLQEAKTLLEELSH